MIRVGRACGAAFFPTEDAESVKPLTCEMPARHAGAHRAPGGTSWHSTDPDPVCHHHQPGIVGPGMLCQLPADHTGWHQDGPTRWGGQETDVVGLAELVAIGQRLTAAMESLLPAIEHLGTELAGIYDGLCEKLRAAREAR